MLTVSNFLAWLVMNCAGAVSDYILYRCPSRLLLFEDKCEQDTTTLSWTLSTEWKLSKCLTDLELLPWRWSCWRHSINYPLWTEMVLLMESTQRHHSVTSHFGGREGTSVMGAKKSLIWLSSACRVMWRFLRWTPTPNCFGVKTSGIVTMTKVDRPYVMCTVLSLECLSARVKLVWSHLSCRSFSILLLRAHQFYLALGALFLRLLTAPWQFQNDVSHLPLVHSLKAWLLARCCSACQGGEAVSSGVARMHM